MPKDDLLDEETSPSQEKQEEPPASRSSVPSSFATFTPHSAHSGWDSDSVDSASASDQSLEASTGTAQSHRSKVQWRNWPNLMTGLLVDVRDTIANRLIIENDEYVADTDEYFRKLKNRLQNGNDRKRAIVSTLGSNGSASSSNQPCQDLQDSYAFIAKTSRCKQIGRHVDVSSLRPCCEHDFQRIISFYLKLNKDGRKLLMRHDDYREWAEAVIAHRDELDCLFHVLSSNPCVINLMYLQRG
jgi:hypothetical protein